MSTTFAEQAYDHIFNLLLRRDLRPGDLVDRKRIAEDLGISLIPVSDAVQRLTHEGFLTTRRRQGTFVRNSPKTLPDTCYFPEILIRVKRILTILIRIHWIILLPLILVLLPSNSRSKEKPFRPKVGEFPPLEKAHSYKGELTFVDHANRRGSLRIDGDGRFRFAAPSPFALLPYGLVRYHGSPADLRDIPLGTVMYAKAFLPPDPKISSVPNLPLDNRGKKYG